MGFTPDDIDTLRGATAIDSAGQKLGEVNQVYLDDSTGDPSWVTVRTGLFGTQETFVPLREATSRSGELHVAVDKATVKDAPRVDADGHLTPDEEQELYRYYGIDGGQRAEAGVVGRGGVDTTDRERVGDDDDRESDGVRDERARAEGVRGDRVDTDADANTDTDADTDTDVDTDSDTDSDADEQERRAETRGRTHDAGADEPTQPAGSEDTDDLDQLSAGGTQSRLRRYVVTERVTRTVEELPDDDNR